jgi:hypothetical protein
MRSTKKRSASLCPRRAISSLLGTGKVIGYNDRRDDHYARYNHNPNNMAEANLAAAFHGSTSFEVGGNGFHV